MTRPITDTLRHIGGGVFVDTASAKLQELVSAVDETGKVKLTKPAEPALEAMLFATPEGNLVADDPHQKKLDLQSVPADTRQPIALKG